MENTLTRTDETMSAYVSGGNRLLDRYCREASVTRENADPVAFVAWLSLQRPHWKASTWRMFRGYVREILPRMPHGNVEQALADLETEIQAKPSSVEKRTSATKSKKLPFKHYSNLEAYLKFFCRSTLAMVARDWVIAGVATGLRPVEWEHARVYGDPLPVLVVKNAKTTNGKGNGEYRHLDLSSFRPETLASVTRLCRIAAEWREEGTYAEMQAKIAQVLYNSSFRLFGDKSYCLYTLRHQFTANMKSLKPLTEVSALLGHKVTTTATENYGKRRDAWSLDQILDVPCARQDEVGTVNDNFVKFSDRVKAIPSAA